MTILQSSIAPPTGGYQISRSLRFNSADSAYLNRTFSSGDQQKFTLSLWVKRSESGTRSIFTCGSSGSSYVQFRFNSGDTLYLASENPSLVMQLETTQVFRDYSAWYHIVLAVDTTQATSSNRVKLYVNGSQITAFSTASYPAQNTNLLINSNIAHYLGTVSYSTGSNLYGGYQTEINFIGGQQLTPSSFGQTNASTGVWEPVKYTGTYGTNGFYLNFSDNSNTTSTTLGKDYSGNGNNWTPNNFSVTAGAGNDSLVDTPTSYGTDTGVGGEVRGNYCTMNPLSGNQYGGGLIPTLTNGNLDATYTGAVSNNVTSTFTLLSGKWYCEFTVNSLSSPNIMWFGCQDVTGFTGNAAAYNSSGQVFCNGTLQGTYSTFTNGDVIGCAFDITNNQVSFYKNNVQQGTTGTLGVTTKTYAVWLQMGNTGDRCTANFGQRPFAYTAPSGFKALCTQNLPTPTIGATSTTQANDYFDILLYNGNNSASTRSITGLEFQPDFIWIKNRNGANSHRLTDAVRGSGISLLSNSTSADVVSTTYAPSAFISGGFQTTTSDNSINGLTTDTYVAWNWKANGAGSSNTAGTITSTVSANTTAGFSIVTYTGNGVDGATVGHGLGIAPKMIIVKCRSVAGASWPVQHASLTDRSYYLYLDSTAAQATGTTFKTTAPTTQVFSIGTAGDVNTSPRTYVAYCFAEVAGYSAFGSYTGNGSTDGPFVYTGFRPRFVMFKVSSSAGYNWVIVDTARNIYNPQDLNLYPNLSAAEDDYTSTYPLDILSNGFKLRANYGNMNLSSGTIIYAAFAESPFKYALAR